jgi:peroxiredoxin
VELKALLTEEQEASTQILALAVDNPEDLQKMVDRISQDDGIVPEFPFLTDPDNSVIDRYGLFNDGDPRGRQLTHPATLLIDKEGVVRWKFIEVDYRVRPTNEDVLDELARIEAGG